MSRVLVSMLIESLTADLTVLFIKVVKKMKALDT